MLNRSCSVLLCFAQLKEMEMENETTIEQLQERAEFQEQFIKDMRIYPRVILFDLYDAEFKKAKLFFGKEVNLDGNEVGFYKKLPGGQHVHTNYQQVYAYQFHMMRMAISPEPMKYLENFHQITLNLLHGQRSDNNISGT